MKKKSLVILLSGLLIFGVAFIRYNHFKTKDKSSDFQMANLESTKDLHLRILTGIIYRHLVGYKMVCKAEGIDLQKYPDYFAQKYAKGISKVDEQWQKTGTNLKEVFVHFDPKIFEKVSAEIKKELIDIERLAAKHIIAQKNNISVDNVEWTLENEKKLNLKDACYLLDNEAPLFLDNSPLDKDFNDRILELK